MRMSSREERKLISRRRNLQRAIEDMDGKPILVEGKKDREALRRCGIIGKIVLINRKPQELCGSLAGANEAVILTDFDEQGEELSVILGEHLRSYGIRPNTECRRRLRYSLGLRVFQEMDRRLEEFRIELQKI
ncbi:MAG: hypothetical protein ABIG39_00145 [Candidatus Micrarchaeota archaeon]